MGLKLTNLQTISCIRAWWTREPVVIAATFAETRRKQDDERRTRITGASRAGSPVGRPEPNGRHVLAIRLH